MSNIVSIHQPSYFSWLGLLDKIEKSDTFVLLDTVQFNDNAFQSRNIFLNHNGEIQYLSIPVQKKDYQKKMLRELVVTDKKWQKKHNGFIIANYKKHPFFDEIYPKINFIFEKKYTFLIDILMDSMEVCNDIFNIKTKMVLASELEIDKTLTKDDLVLDILKKTKATKYISGIGAKDYQDDKKFDIVGIDLEYQKFSHPSYSQKNSQKFEVGLSSMDIAFNLGCKKSEKLLKGNLI
jgi:hypothetical protein